MPTRPVTPGTATAITTGAPMPEGADAVVMIEDTDGARSGAVTIRATTTPGRYVRRRGADVAQGTTVLRAGDRLSAGSIGMAAALGHAALPVACRPRVALLSTGDEVVPPGQPLQPGQLWSSNTVALSSLVRDAGGVPVDRGNAADRLEDMVASIQGCLDCDVVVTTGGVSMGDYDVVRPALEALGIRLDFWKVRMKPGKPLAFGEADAGGRSVALFGLPGNPVSCMVGFLQFVRPFLLRMQGASAPFLPVVEAIAAGDLRARPGRARLERVILEQTARGWRCRSTGSQSSGVLTSMVCANGLALIGPDDPGPAPGEVVRVQLIDHGALHTAEHRYGW